MKYIFTFLFSFFSLFGVDIVICSFNRPLQLYALLESMETYVSGASQVSVVCRSAPDFVKGYDIVQKRFPDVKFYFQHHKSRFAFRQFKPMILGHIFGKESSASEYFLFAMDDIIVTAPIDLEKDSAFLGCHDEVHGFFYRLGKNVNRHALPKPGKNRIPELDIEEDGIYTWSFSSATYDWAYPNSLDFTIYRKKDFEKAFKQRLYRNPTILEHIWHKHYQPQKGARGACYETSKIVNLMINRVTTLCKNPVIKNIPVEELQKKFMAGKKIDIFSIDTKSICSAHQAVDFVYVDRE